MDDNTMGLVRSILRGYGAHMRRLRLGAQLSQLQAAHIVGVSQAIISHIECGYFIPPNSLKAIYWHCIKQAHINKTKRKER